MRALRRRLYPSTESRIRRSPASPQARPTTQYSPRESAEHGRFQGTERPWTTGITGAIGGYLPQVQFSRLWLPCNTQHLWIPLGARFKALVTARYLISPGRLADRGMGDASAPLISERPADLRPGLSFRSRCDRRCLLWVKSRHHQTNKQCLLCAITGHRSGAEYSAGCSAQDTGRLINPGGQFFSLDGA
jgi:hypothetical protein